MQTAARQLSASERLDWLRLIRSEGVGPITFYRLLERFGTARAALEALPELAKRGGKRSLVIHPAAKAEQEIGAHEKLGARLVAWGEAEYPKRLQAVEDAPPLISVLGNVHILQKPMVAMVGARNASLAGKKRAHRLAEELTKAGLVVVSGMARGIDGAAHEGALSGGTVAVLAGGVDHIYPPEHENLYRRIISAGIVVSEQAPGTVPQASFFPRRNRIISGMAMGVLVVEAGLKSGSLITARQALDQGREIFAVPGAPEDLRASGPNSLLRQGAVLVERAEDIINALNDLLRRPLSEPDRLAFPAAPPAQPSPAELDSARDKIAIALSPVPVAVDEILRQCELSLAVVATVLLELELAGRLERHPGNRVALLP
jgi:DNA processing protein